MPATLDTTYWIVLGTAIVAACGVVLGIAAGRLGGRREPVATLLAIVAVVVAGRWPGVLIPGPLNPDESMMLAQAMKFGTDLMPWRAMDPGTGGPVNSYVLLAGHWLGLPYGYPLARIMSMACLAIALGLGYLALRRIGGPRAAAVAVLPTTVFLATATGADFLHYSSELASLSAIALLGFVVAGFDGSAGPWRRDVARALAAGACAFVVAMSKVQGVPLGAAVAFGALALTAPDVPTFLRRSGMVAAGAVLCVAALLLLLASMGLVGDFKASFIDLPAAYASDPMSYGQTKRFVMDTAEARSYVQATTWLVLIALAAQLLAWRGTSLAGIALRAACLVVFLAAIFVTLAQPGRGFPHYLNYLSVAGLWMLFLALPWRPSLEAARTLESRHGT